MTMDCEEDAAGRAPASKPAFPDWDLVELGHWGLLEIFGHQRHYGFITEVERFGVKFARVAVPSPDAAQKDPASVHLCSGKSIFRVTQLTEAEVREQIRYAYQPPLRLREASEPDDVDPDHSEDEEDDDDAGL